ncbi:hypothetical protein EDB89DRAFT_2228622 [Lactarius sanguifluus]|nr:hypothetical protein EDB89DRAFT_2228622 [Lactarius sanguifluus]
MSQTRLVNKLSRSMLVTTAHRNISSSTALMPDVLAGALFTKSKVLSSQKQHHLAYVASAEAVSLLRGISAQRHVFSLILGHVLDTRSRQLLSANQIADSYSVAKEAVELWRALLMSAPGPIRWPLGALVHQAKFRQKKQEESDPWRRIGQCSLSVADRMREPDERRAATALAEEVVTRLQEPSSEAPDVHSLDLIFSLSLDAVEEQREREEAADVQYSGHLRQLLRDVVLRFTEMDRQEEAQPWFEEMHSLGHSGEIGGFSLLESE